MSYFPQFKVYSSNFLHAGNEYLNIILCDILKGFVKFSHHLNENVVPALCLFSGLMAYPPSIRPPFFHLFSFVCLTPFIFLCALFFSCLFALSVSDGTEVERDKETP